MRLVFTAVKPSSGGACPVHPSVSLNHSTISSFCLFWSRWYLALAEEKYTRVSDINAYVSTCVQSELRKKNMPSMVTLELFPVGWEVVVELKPKTNKIMLMSMGEGS